jgi:thioredoxin:protein disulfide reductase
VASPCIGPAVAGVAVWVTQLKNPVLGFWIFFSLALGLGLPFMVLAMFSGAIERLPQAGAWMVSVKKLSGLALLGAAVYFGQLLLPLPARQYAMPVFLIGAAVYLTRFKSRGSFGRRTIFARTTLGVVLLLAGVWSLVPHSPRQSISWQPYTAQAMEQAAKDKRPVMIDFTAAWCTVCKDLDERTFTDVKVVRGSCTFVSLRADMTRKSKETDALVKQYGVKGLPTILFIDSQGREVRDKRVIGFVTPSEFLNRMNAVQ